MKLELLLKGIDQLSPVVKKQSPLLRQLSRDALKAYNNLKKLFSLSPKNTFKDFGKQSAAEFRKANKEAGNLKKTLQSIGRIKVKMPKIETSGTDAARSIRRERKELDKLFNERQKSSKYSNRLAGLNDRFLEPAMQTKNVWREQIDSLKQYTDEATRALRVQERFKLINLSEADNQKAFASVRQNTKNVRGISLADSQELFTSIFNALGNVDQAIQALPMASKYKVASNALYGDIYSPEEINNQIQRGFKFLELTGATKDRASMEARFDTLTKIANSTGGEVTMAKLLALSKQAAPAVQGLSEKGIFNITSVVDEMGGDRTGTALSALYRAWVGGIMPQHVAKRYQDLGLVDPNKVEYNQSGLLKRIQPGGNVLGDLMLKDPLAAADRLVEAIKADAAKKGIDVSTPELLNRQMRGMFGTETQFRLANSLINNRAQVEKESSRAENSKGAIATYDSMDERLKQMEEYKAALVNFKTEAGIPLIKAMSQLAQAATPLLQFFGEHPEVTKYALAALLVGKAVSGIAQTASIFSGSGLLSFFRNSQTSANAATQSIQTFSSEAKGLRGRNIPVGVQIASVIGIDLLIRLIEWEIGKAIEARTAQRQAAEATQTNYKVFQNAKKNGVQFSQSDLEGQASAAWASVMNLGLKDSLRSEVFKKPFWSWSGDSKLSQAGRETFLYPMNTNAFQAGGWSGFFKGRQNNVPAMAEGFRNTAGILSDPQVMLSFLKQLPGRVGDKGDQQSVRQSLEMAFPESYKQAAAQLAEQTSGLSQSFLNLIQPSADLGTGFTTLNTNTGNAVTGMGNFASSANSLAMRINGIEIIPPTFAPIQVPIYGQNPATTPPFGPGRARGGSVKRGKTHPVGENGLEWFTSERSGSIIPNDVLRRSRAAAASVVHVNFSPTVNVDSDNPNANQIADKVNRELAKFKSEIAALLDPDRLAQKVEWAAQRDAERL